MEAVSACFAAREFKSNVESSNTKRAGSMKHSSFTKRNAVRAGIIDKLVVFIAPKILGGREIPAIGGEGIEKLSAAIPLGDWTIQHSGPDLVLTGYVHRHH